MEYFVSLCKIYIFGILNVLQYEQFRISRAKVTRVIFRITSIVGWQE